MIHTQIPIYLASQSPRRKKLLHQIGLQFKVVKIEFDEKTIKGENPSSMVKRLASGKIEAAKDTIKKGIIITADTVVAIDHKILGKPKDEKDAIKMLKTLSGKTHAVYTGISIYNTENKKSITTYAKTNVTFRELDIEEIKEYIKGGSPMDKAGAYGIQDDYGAVFVRKISGCYYNVVGMPLAKLYSNLKRIL